MNALEKCSSVTKSLKYKMYFFYFWKTALQLVAYFIRERKKEAIHAVRVITDLEKKLNGQFDSATRKKIIISHSVYNPLVIDAFCRLHGRVSNKKERKKLIYYFTCSSVLDNFFDYGELSYNQIISIYTIPTYQPSTFSERVGMYCHWHLLDKVTDKVGYMKILDAEVNAQHASLQQFNKQISIEEIESIMKAKGGNAVLLCRYYLDYEPSEAEDKCWFQLGVIIQLNNDLYDIHKDINDGIETLATRCRDANLMEAYVKKQASLMKHFVSELPCSNRRKRRFSVSAAGVFALAMVAVDQLKRLQGTAEQLPDFNKLKRKDIIVDMEKTTNILRCLKYMYQYNDLN